MMYRRIISALLLTIATAATPAVAADNPALFGLEIGSNCDALQSFDARLSGVSSITGGQLYEVDVSSIHFDGLRSLKVVCSQSETIAAVIAGFRKRFGGATFDQLRAILEEDYVLEQLDEAHVGDQEAWFSHGDARILLEEPHMSRTTSLVYMTDTFNQQYEQHLREQAREREEREAGHL